MAEFCNKCAREMGFEKVQYPVMCEGCGKYFEVNRLKEALKVAIVLVIIIVTFLFF